MIKTILIAVGVLFVLVMAAGLYMARFACLRKKVPDYWTDPDAMPPIYEHVPETDHPWVLAGREFLRSHAQPPVYITSRDGLRLQGHYVPPEGDPKGIFLQVHGYRSHPLCDFSGCARGMHEKGYGLFLIDHRAGGGSESHAAQRDAAVRAHGGLCRLYGERGLFRRAGARLYEAETAQAGLLETL